MRDDIAITVMKQFINLPLPEGHSWNKENIAKDSYAFADAMLEARDLNDERE